MEVAEAVSPSRHILKAVTPTKLEKWTLRVMVLASFFWLIIFIWWFFGKPRIGNPYLYWPLTIALILKLMQRAYEWYHYFDISVPEKPKKTREFNVDMLTTACPGEPRAMIIRTLQKMVAVTYPHTTYLCDEGDDPVLRKVCTELGVVHVTRTEKKNAKAGNVNNALQQATGELCVIMDPDHEPIPEFLDRVLPYFEDEQVGYVQVVQGYYNQEESFVAKAAAEQTYHFYGPMMMCMHSYGTSQAIGANCTFRRSALDSIGGHAAGLTEDMHTSMKLQAKGWKAMYVPEMLSKGLVPSTVSAFYKQQLKWGRGTFELFLEVLPGLFSQLSWRQRFHHLMAPVYYLSGVTNLINILIPILALFLGEFPWKVDIETFILFYSPLLFMTLLIRQYSQKWLMEESEMGFHMRGGLLQLGTWWVYVVGFVYSLFRVKVPYIPTPKEGSIENNWKIVLPNLIAAALSIGAIAYGLMTDLTPYSVFMAGFALVNAVFLLSFSLIVQQKLMAQLKAFVYRITGIPSFYAYKVILWKWRHAVYLKLREMAFTLSIVMVASFAYYQFSKKAPEKSMVHALSKEMKKTGGFYKGVYIANPAQAISLDEVADWESATGSNVNIVSFYQAWGPQSISDFPDSILNIAMREKGMTPMITWEPWSSTFPEFKEDFNLATDRKVMAAITEGKFDFYLSAYCEKIRALPGAVFLRFAHEPDNPQYPWSKAGANTAAEFREAHRYVVNFFAVRGVANVAWVYNPWNDKNAEAYYPGDDFVDWIGVTGLNYGSAAMDGKWRSFKQIYEPFRKTLLKHNKPVMVAEFGSTNYGGDQQAWLNEALYTIGNEYKEIKSVTFFYSYLDRNWTTSWRPKDSNGYIDWTFANRNKCLELLHYYYSMAPYDQAPNVKPLPSFSDMSHATGIQRNGISFQLMSSGKPFYIQGIAYNTGSDWRDGNIPLTRKVLDEDFAAIKKMGANTIRRYSSSLYDDNILLSAKQNGLKVLYGFWVDPTVDYYVDGEQEAAYLKEIEEKVTLYRNDSTVVAWCVGNETWGLLKHSFVQPYLSKVRKGYTLFLEKAAKRIHELDPARPVLTAMEHTKELPAELKECHQLASSIDMAGINSYYIENIRVLDSIAGHYYPDKPYVVSEFGPKGYWNKYLSQLKSDSIIEEEGDREKAAYYVKQWKEYVTPYQGHNVGGVAYCWHDRLEGTATWYGITDYKGRKKPLYYALQEIWTGEKSHPSIPRFDIEWEQDTLIPGKYAAFHVKEGELGKQALRFEWYLRKEATMEEYPGYVREFHDGKRIFMKIPLEPGLYRLYLYVYDDLGNVSSISHPINVHFPVPKKKQPTHPTRS